MAEHRGAINAQLVMVRLILQAQAASEGAGYPALEPSISDWCSLAYLDSGIRSLTLQR